MSEGKRQTRRSGHLHQPVASFSHAVRCGSHVYVGAKGSLTPMGVVHAGDPAAQAIQVLTNASSALHGLGSSLAEVVELRIWLTDWRWLPAVRDAIEGHFAPSVRTQLHHSVGLPFPGFLVEADMIAVDSSVDREPLSLDAGVVAIAVDGLLFVEDVGQPDLPGWNDDLPSEGEARFERLHAVLQAADLDQDNLAQVRVSLADVRDAGSFRTVWRSMFRPPRPPLVISCSALETSETRVSVSAVASFQPARKIAFPSISSGNGTEESAGASAGSLLFTAASDAIWVLQENGKGERVSSHSPSETLAGYLALADSDTSRLVRVGAAVADWGSYPKLNEDYDLHLAPPFPARTTVAAQLLNRDVRFQLEGIARTDDEPLVFLTS